jgi:hypothetical protein
MRNARRVVEKLQPTLEKFKSGVPICNLLPAPSFILLETYSALINHDSSA